MPLDVAQLKALRPSNEFHYLPILGSTMTEAATLVAGGAPHGTVVIADEQQAGVGRLGRTWHSEKDSGVYCSIVLKLDLATEQLPLLMLALGLATRDAISEVTGILADLRWPNDVLIRERKTAGVIAHFAEGAIVAGIGVNTNQSHFPNGLRTPATSLAIELGRNVSREALLAAMLESVDDLLLRLINSPQDITTAFSEASSYAQHRRVVIEETGRHGTTAGLDPSGFLLVRYDGGSVERVAAGGIRPEM